mmetsp:Transcript_80222/g.227143  ORF Transcript_80222/g.227143 Transcript_80222/m.227143 type:complete len:315 (+) Transcript_80222:114-1058(+)
MSPPPCSYDDELDDEVSEDLDDDVDSGESEASSDGERTPAAGVVWPDPFDAGTDTSSPTGDERPSPREAALSKRLSNERPPGSKREDGMPDAGFEEGAEVERRGLLHGSSSTESPWLAMDSPAAASGPSLGSSGGARSGSGTRTDRVAMALSQAAAAAASAPSSRSGPSVAMLGGPATGAPGLQRPPSLSYCLHAPPVLSAMRGRSGGQGGRRLWQGDSSSTSSEGEVRRRGRKRKGWWEPPQGAKKLRQQQDRAPDFPSMSSMEMNDYVRWWRKMHALTWRRGLAGAPSSRADVPLPGTPQGAVPADRIQQSR